MIIILVILTAFISISIDYFMKLNNVRKKEEKLLKEAINDRNKAFKEVLNYQ